MEKNAEYYLSLNYPYTIEEEEEEGRKVFVARIPDLPGCWAIGESLEEARTELEEAKALWIEESLKSGLPVPEPSIEFSGRVLLRIPPALHGRMSKLARQAGLSLNQYIRGLLEERLDLRLLIARMQSIEERIDRNEVLLSAVLKERWPFQWQTASPAGDWPVTDETTYLSVQRTWYYADADGTSPEVCVIPNDLILRTGFQRNPITLPNRGSYGRDKRFAGSSD